MALGVPIAILLAAFAAAPWIAHRIRLRTMRTKALPTLRWIRTAQVKHERASRVSDKRLLMLRIAAVLAIVALAADPSCSKEGPTAAHAVFFVLDDSFSMSAREEGGSSAFDRAKGRVVRLARELPADAEVTLVLAGKRPRIAVAGASPAAAVESATALRTATRGPGLASAIRLADRLASESAFADRAIVVVSDFAAHEELGDLQSASPVHYESVAETPLPGLDPDAQDDAPSAPEVFVLARSDDAAAPVLSALRALYGPAVALETNEARLASDLALARLVMVVDGMELSPDARERIDAWVKRGGGLFLAPNVAGGTSFSGFERLVRDELPSAFDADDPRFANVPRGDGRIVAMRAPLTDAAAALTLSERFVPFVASVVRAATGVPKLGRVVLEAGNGPAFDVDGGGTLTTPSGATVPVATRVDLSTFDELGGYSLRMRQRPERPWVFWVRAPESERGRREVATPAPQNHSGSSHATPTRRPVPLRPWALFAVISILCAEWLLRSDVAKRLRLP